MGFTEEEILRKALQDDDRVGEIFLEKLEPKGEGLFVKTMRD